MPRAFDPDNLDAYADEVIAGLPNAKADLDRALENQAFYDRDAERYLPRRDAESAFDFQGRPKRSSGLTREVIEVLTEHLYCPGPSRRFDDPAGDEFLQRVWSDNLYDALLHRADALATLNDVCAIQVDAGAGVFEAKPLTLRLWGREEFHVWTHPDDCTLPVAVVTIDRYNLQTRYRLWGKDEVRTYLTKQGGGTSGGVVAREVSREPNTYGTVPFGFVHYDLPVRRFETPGPGTFLRKAEVRTDHRLSLLDESISKHLNPIPVAENVPLEWQPILEPQRFIRLFGAGPALGASGGAETGGAARLYYLQAMIDVAGAWTDLLNYLNGVLEACRVPLSAVRMEQTGVASGIALIAEQAPLLTRARARRNTFGVFEGRLARLILACAGSHYGRSDLTRAAEQGRLTLGWAEPTIPIPGPDRDEADKSAIVMGVKSVLQVIQERYGIGREQALAVAEAVLRDQADLDALRRKLGVDVGDDDETETETTEDTNEQAD